MVVALVATELLDRLDHSIPQLAEKLLAAQRLAFLVERHAFDMLAAPLGRGRRDGYPGGRLTTIQYMPTSDTVSTNLVKSTGLTM